MDTHFTGDCYKTIYYKTNILILLLLYSFFL